MILLHLKKDLEDNLISGVSNVSFFVEEDPLFGTEDYHVALFSAGGNRAWGRNTSTQTFDIEVRGKSTATSMHLLEKIAEYYQGSELCTLPTISGVSSRLYKNCRVMDISNASNLGKDNENKTVFRLTATAYYNK